MIRLSKQSLLEVKCMYLMLASIAVMLLCGIGCTTVQAQSVDADHICGTYDVPSPFSDDEAHVCITKTSKGTYQGRIVWVNRDTNPDGTPRTDEKNPDPKLRSRQATDIVMCWNLKYEEGMWVNGVLYDPYSGKRFGIRFKPAKNGKDLDARYYKGKPAFGINAVWKRM